VLDTPDYSQPAATDFKGAYENGLVFQTFAQYTFTAITVERNRNLGGQDLRLRLIR